MPTKQEKRKVLTLWGHRGWHVPNSDDDYNTGSLNRGYRSLNRVIASLAEKITIHSVSFSAVPIPDKGPCQLIHVSATIVYSGTFDINKEYMIKCDRTDDAKLERETVFEVHM